MCVSYKSFYMDLLTRETRALIDASVGASDSSLINLLADSPFNRRNEAIVAHAMRINTVCHSSRLHWRPATRISPMRDCMSIPNLSHVSLTGQDCTDTNCGRKGLSIRTFLYCLLHIRSIKPDMLSYPSTTSLLDMSCRMRLYMPTPHHRSTPSTRSSFSATNRSIPWQMAILPLHGHPRTIQRSL